MGDAHEYDGDLARSRGSTLLAAVKTWWVAYLTWRIERVAIAHLDAMSDRELEDMASPGLRSSRR
jgi:hypothetical protein